MVPNANGFASQWNIGLSVQLREFNLIHHLALKYTLYIFASHQAQLGGFLKVLEQTMFTSLLPLPHPTKHLSRRYGAQSVKKLAVSACGSHGFLLTIHTLHLIYLRLNCDLTFEYPAMTCNKSFNMLNSLLAILRLISLTSWYDHQF